MSSSQPTPSHRDHNDLTPQDLFAEQLCVQLNLDPHVGLAAAGSPNSNCASTNLKKNSTCSPRPSGNLNLSVNRNLSINHPLSVASGSKAIGTGIHPREVLPEDKNPNQNPVFPSLPSQDSSIDRIKMNLAGWGLNIGGTPLAGPQCTFASMARTSDEAPNLATPVLEPNYSTTSLQGFGKRLNVTQSKS